MTRSGPRLQAYLRAGRRFPSYSWRNVLLMLHQRPTATRVAGFRTWLDLGYSVRKRPERFPRASGRSASGPHLQPSRRRLDAWRAGGADPDERPRASYKLVSDFPQDQVQELPPPATPAPLTAPIAEIHGDSHDDLVPGLAGLSAELCYTFTVGDAGVADGQSDIKAKAIVSAERLDPNGRVLAAIHELSHALVAEDVHAPKLTYTQEELVAESVAWCCCQTVGLDSSANSIPYLTGWAERADLDVLEQTRRAHQSPRRAHRGRPAHTPGRRRLTTVNATPTTSATPELAKWSAPSRGRSSTESGVRHEAHQPGGHRAPRPGRRRRPSDTHLVDGGVVSAAAWVGRGHQRWSAAMVTPTRPATPLSRLPAARPSRRAGPVRDRLDPAPGRS